MLRFARGEFARVSRSYYVHRATAKPLRHIRKRMKRRRRDDGRCRKKAGKFTKKILVLSGLGFDLDIGAEDLGLSPSAKDEREGEQGDATAGSGKFGGGK